MKATLIAVDGERVEHRGDRLAVEEPLAIRVVTPDGRRHDVAVTMRTPGDTPTSDEELAIGFLLGEGVIRGREELDDVTALDNRVDVALASGARFDPDELRRNVYATSSCGVCGKASIEQLERLTAERPRSTTTIAPATLLSLPEILRRAQDGFAATGGLHAAALFTPDGRLLSSREDVGRHNATDKVIGRLLLDGQLPASDRILLLSGRASWELVQKALLAGIPTLAAVGAPSTLAVALARRFDLTLIGFLRGVRFNLYTGAERVDLGSETATAP